MGKKQREPFDTYALVEIDACSDLHLLGRTEDIWDCRCKSDSYGCYYYWTEVHIDGCRWHAYDLGKPIYNITEEVGNALQKQSRINVSGVAVPMTDREDEIVMYYTQLLTD